MAPNHLGITDTGRMEAPSRHFPWQLFAIAILFIAGGIIVGFSQTLWKNSTLPAFPTQGGEIAPAVELSATPTPTQELVYFGVDRGTMILGRPDTYDMRHLSPPGPNVPREYSFPLYIMKYTNETSSTKPKEKILAAIANPNLKEMGAEWNSDPIRDPDNPSFVLKVKLIRSADEEKVSRTLYDYQIILLYSNDGGQTWWGP